MGEEDYDIGPGADLEGAKLDNANLKEADLSRAHLKGANLYGAKLLIMFWNSPTNAVTPRV